ncbi:MAG: hypothetical protein WC205_12440 [Opitutaceae bacterium]|jgi:hypothetical protein
MITSTNRIQDLKTNGIRLLSSLSLAGALAALPPSLSAQEKQAAVGAPQPQRLVSAVFDQPGARHEWTLPELAGAGFELPSDWTGYNFLVLDMRASSAEKFDLRIRDNGRWWRLMVYPLQGPWIRVCIPLQYYRQLDQQGPDVAALGNKSFETFLLGLTGARTPLDKVSALGVEMKNPLRAPRLEIRNIQLSRESLANKLLEPGPVVDEFGQWIPDNWPGKASSLEQLHSDWRAEEQALASSNEAGDTCFGYGKFGGYRGVAVKPMGATGFFRTEKQDGRWWLVDPEGLPFFSVGANRVHWGDTTFVHETTWRGRHYKGREEMFAALPPDSLRIPSATAPDISLYAWNLRRRYGDDPGWVKKWEDTAFSRMAGWGLNTVPSGAEPAVYQAGRMAYAFIIYNLGVQEGIMGMPDVYSEEWLKRVDAAVRKSCAPLRDDPWLLGYFVGNEPPFPRRESLVVDAIMKGPDTATRRHLADWLAAGDTHERRVTWVYDSYKRFLDGAIAAVRRYDPNHLILGARYSSPSDDILRVASDFDVVSFNCYQEKPDQRVLDFVERELDKPVLIGEFHFGTPGRGLAGGLVVVKDQKERGTAYQYYMEQAAASPAVVGTYWYQWVDQPSTGRPDGERFNIGLVDVTDRPYPELIEALRRTHRRLGDIHAGTEPPVSLRAEKQ